MIGGNDILLQTETLEATASFYEQQLGLRRVLTEKNLVALSAGGFTLYLDRGPAFGPVLEFFVPDLAAAKTRLLASGCVLEQEDAAIPRCYLRDPFGLIFNLHEKREAVA